MSDNPEKVGLPTIQHRITDNCGFEYNIMKTCPCNIIEIFLAVKIDKFSRKFLIYLLKT